MKKAILLIFLSVQLLKAENTHPIMQQLCAVNSEWKKQTDVSPALFGTIRNKQYCFNDWIATHLMLVEKTLRARNISTLSASQKQNRLTLLNELNGYWKAGRFPVNDYLPYKNPVFIDREGTHCAVGYLMMQSGKDDLAQSINAAEKFAYVHEIKTKGVKEWADENGFTIDELAWIQPGYPPTTTCYDLDGGLNGTVNAIAHDSSGQVIYVAGSFTQSISGMACQNIGAWISGIAGWDWTPVGSGLNGTVHTLLLRNYKLYAGGEFTLADTTAVNHVAVYDIALGQWQALGSLDSTVRALAFYNGELYAGGNFTGFVSKWNGTQWVDVTQGFIYGEGVRTLEVWNNELVIGGSFELATGALRKHVSSYNGTYMASLGFGTVTPVNDFAVHEGKLFAACDVVSGSDTCALASYENGDWQVRLTEVNGISSYFAGNSLNALLSANGHLYAGGDFSCGFGMTYGNNLAQLSASTWGDTSRYDCMPLTVLDNRVNALTAYYNSLYFGGDFIAGLGDTTNHIAYLQFGGTGIKPVLSSTISFSVFPNPATSSIQVLFKDNDAILQMELLDVAGRKVEGENSMSVSKSISVASLASGIYTLRVRTANGWGAARLIKE